MKAGNEATVRLTIWYPEQATGDPRVWEAGRPAPAGGCGRCGVDDGKVRWRAFSRSRQKRT